VFSSDVWFVQGAIGAARDRLNRLRKQRDDMRGKVSAINDNISRVKSTFDAVWFASVPGSVISTPVHSYFCVDVTRLPARPLKHEDATMSQSQRARNFESSLLRHMRRCRHRLLRVL
jgi:hypothetical protein